MAGFSVADGAGDAVGEDGVVDFGLESGVDFWVGEEVEEGGADCGCGCFGAGDASERVSSLCVKCDPGMGHWYI